MCVKVCMVIFLCKIWWLLQEPFSCVIKAGNHLLAACVFGDRLGSLIDGAFGQLTGKKKTNSGLSFPPPFSLNVVYL